MKHIRRSHRLRLYAVGLTIRAAWLSLCFLFSLLICRLRPSLDCAFADPMPEEGIDTQVLLQLDAKDTVTIEPKMLIKKCSSILSSKDNKLSPDQLHHLHALRANALITLDKDKEALEDLEYLKKELPEDLDIVERHAAALANSGRSQDALKVFQKLAEKHPNRVESHLYLAMYHLRVGDLKKSMSYCNSAINLEKNNPLALFERSCVYAALQENARALEDINKCIELGGIRVGSPDAAVPYACRAALLLGKYGVLPTVLSDLLMAKQLDPTSVEADQGFWAYYFLQGKYQLAAHISKKAVKKERLQSYTLLMRAASLINEGEGKKALPLISRSVTKNPRSAYAHLRVGHAFFSLGQYDRAIIAYDRAILLRPNDPQIMGSMSYLRCSCPDQKYRNGAEALKMARRCCDITENRKPSFLMLFACSQAECGNYDLAVRSAENALKIAGPDFHLRKEYERRRDLFRHGKPYRYKPDSSIHDFLLF